MYNIEHYDNVKIDVKGIKATVKKLIKKNGKEHWVEVKKFKKKSVTKNKTYEYWNICLKHNNGTVYTLYLHKFLAKNLINNEDVTNKYVTFKDGDTLNCNLNNLVWCNMREAVKRELDDKKIEFIATKITEPALTNNNIDKQQEKKKEKHLTGDITKDYNNVLFWTPLFVMLFLILTVITFMFIN